MLQAAQISQLLKKCTKKNDIHDLLSLFSPTFPSIADDINSGSKRSMAGRYMTDYYKIMLTLDASSFCIRK